MLVSEFHLRLRSRFYRDIHLAGRGRFEGVHHKCSRNHPLGFSSVTTDKSTGGLTSVVSRTISGSSKSLAACYSSATNLVHVGPMPTDSSIGAAVASSLAFREMVEERSEIESVEAPRSMAPSDKSSFRYPQLWGESFLANTGVAPDS
jgi:hypothetical protein